MALAQRSSSAYQQEEYYIYKPIEKQKVQVRKKRKGKVGKTASQKFKMILEVLFCFGIAFIMIFRYVSITEASHQLSRYQKELKELQTANEQMQIAIERSIDLKKVEEIANTQLNMKQPDKYQMVYVDLKKQDYAELVNPNLYETPNNQWFAVIFKAISNVLEYLY